MQKYVFLTTFAIVDVIFPATFIYFYAFFLTKFTFPLLFPQKMASISSVPKSCNHWDGSPDHFFAHHIVILLVSDAKLCIYFDNAKCLVRKMITRTVPAIPVLRFRGPSASWHDRCGIFSPPCRIRNCRSGSWGCLPAHRACRVGWRVVHCAVSSAR